MAHGFTFSPTKASELLGHLSNEQRLIVLQLTTQKEWDVSSLATAIDLSQSATSQHLKRLRDADLVTTRREAQSIYYSCADPRIAKVLKVLEEIYGHSVSSRNGQKAQLRK